MRGFAWGGVALAVVGVGSPVRAEEPPSREAVTQAMNKAIEFFQKDVRADGGYLWNYSADLKLREGEGRNPGSAFWVQPPGTPTIGLAFLAAFEATRNPAYLQAAKEAALALTRGQLVSGGWTYKVENDPALRKKVAYRVDGNPKGFNYSTLDDNNTQEALRFLMKTDRALDEADATIHEAVTFALTSLLTAQYPNGAWTQGYNRAVDPAGHPVKNAGYPESWPREWPKAEYWLFYTLNDHVMSQTIDTMFLAADLYRDDRYRASALKGGDFLLLAQMPDPQPAWAQQYDPEMHPVWARKFEPPAVSGWESQSVMEALFQLYRRTGDKKFLEPIPRALAYLKKSRLPSGRLARFYELKTNTPLYFTKDYKLTYKDDSMPTHYGFTQPSRLDAIEAEYDTLMASGPKPQSAEPSVAALAEKVAAILKAQDARGAWVEKGALKYHKEAGDAEVIRCQTFADNVETLAKYLTPKR